MMSKLSFKQFLLNNDVDILLFIKNCTYPYTGWSVQGERPKSYKELLNILIKDDRPEGVLMWAFNWGKALQNPQPHTHSTSKFWSNLRIYGRKS